MNASVDNMIHQCHACQLTTPAKTKYQPLTPITRPCQNWELVAIYLKGQLPSGESILVSPGTLL